MKQETIGALALAAGLVLAGTVLAGDNVWVSDSGEDYTFSHAVFIGEDHEVFDVADLADGETRIFGSGDKQLTAHRNGDEVTLERPATDEERALSITCRLDSDSCKVMTSDDDDKVAIMIRKSGGAYFGEEMADLGDGLATIVVEKMMDCDDGEECIAEVHVESGGHHEGHSVVEITSFGEGEALHDVMIRADRLHPHAAMISTDGATIHDLSELFDGETRIFGGGDDQLTAVRDGDRVEIIREATEDTGEMKHTCTIGRDSCQVLTFDDDPDKVALILKKRCSTDEGDCGPEVLHLEMGEGTEDVKVIKLSVDGGVVVSEPDADGHKARHRVMIVTEDD